MGKLLEKERNIACTPLVWLMLPHGVIASN
jgi:hypothetical protein